MEENAKIIQERFIQQIKSALPTNVSFVDELADLLSLSTDSAYRRIRCETLFNIAEITLICKHFKVSFEPELQHLANKVSFDYLKLDDKKDNFKLWLHAMGNDIKKISTSSSNEILYAADDVPVWHHFFSDEMISFKLFYWLKCILCAPEFSEKLFDPKEIDHDLITYAKDLLNNYNKTTSIEIWTEDTINSTLKQIEYFWESGFFKKQSDALLICDLLNEEINQLQDKVAKGNKMGDASKPDNFRFYKSEVMIGNNSILANIGTTKIAYVSNNTFNMMSTTNADFVNENEHWLKNLVKKSTLLSGIAEKQRNQFFRLMRDKIDRLRNRISSEN
jgi:hypothetical protein